MPSSSPRAGLGLAQVRDWGAEVEVRVTDTGVGIGADDLLRIFDPYRQAHTGRKGSGLGLAVVRGLVETTGSGHRRIRAGQGELLCGDPAARRMPVVSRARAAALIAAVALLGGGCTANGWKGPVVSGRGYRRSAPASAVAEPRAPAPDAGTAQPRG